MDSATEAIYSKAVQDALQAQSTTIEGTYNSRNNIATRRDALHDIYMQTHLREATRILGLKKAHRSGRIKDHTHITNLFTKVHGTISAAILTGEECISIEPSLAQRLQTINQLKSTLRADLAELDQLHIQVPLSHGWETIHKWCLSKDYHMGQIRQIGKTCTLTDQAALRNPKKLFRQICKPPGSSKISSLRRGNVTLTSPKEIETELTNFLKKTGGKYEHIPPMNEHRLRNHTIQPPNPLLRDLLIAPSTALVKLVVDII